MKRIIAAFLVALLLLSLTSAIAASPGSAADPLISLSYINDTFLPSTLSDCQSQCQAPWKRFTATPRIRSEPLTTLTCCA
jgi:hypothetical protein